MDTLIYFAALLIFLYGLVSALADRSPLLNAWARRPLLIAHGPAGEAYSTRTQVRVSC